MRILFLSWRDHTHPKAGGAARYVHEISKRLVGRGCSVTVISQRYPGSARRETVDGVEIVRTGGPLTVFPLAIWEYVSRWRGKCDVVVDHHVLFPFMTPLFVQGRRLLLTHHIAESAEAFQLPFPFNYPGHILHKAPLALYRSGTVITVSDSTARELRSMGFRNIHIVGNGSGINPPAKPPRKNRFPTFVYLGRISAQKNTMDAVAAFILIKRSLPDAMLILAGAADPDYLGEVMHAAESAGVAGSVRVLGYIPEAEKAALLGQAHAFLFPARKEGWGQTVIEANALGLPAIGYDVPGLRDSIIHGRTGFLVSGAEEMAGMAVRLVRDSRLRKRMSRAAREFASGLDWQESSDKFRRIAAAKPRNPPNAAGI